MQLEQYNSQGSSQSLITILEISAEAELNGNNNHKGTIRQVG